MKQEFETIAHGAGDGAGPAAPPPAKPPVLTLDVSLYEKYLADSDMTDDQKREFLEALWTIVVGFVDLGFGIHPVQQVLGDVTIEPVGEKSGADTAVPAQTHQDTEGKRSLRLEVAGSFAAKEEE